MRKYFYSVLIMVIFAIGFAASSDDSSSSSSKSPEERKQEKMERMKDRGYKFGYENGFRASETAYKVDTKDGYKGCKGSARNLFIGVNAGAPHSAEEKELCNVFTEGYIKGYEDGYRDQ